MTPESDKHCTPAAPSVPNPCSVCGFHIFGSFIGTGDGSMKDGGSFAHPECYWKDQARIWEQRCHEEEKNATQHYTDLIALRASIPSTTPQKTLATHITDESLERINDLHKIVRDNARSDYHEAMEKFQNLVGVMWENIYSRCAGTIASATPWRPATRESLPNPDDYEDTDFMVLGWLPNADSPAVVPAVAIRRWVLDHDPVVGAQWMPIPKRRADGGKQT